MTDLQRITVSIQGGDDKWPPGLLATHPALGMSVGGSRRVPAPVVTELPKSAAAR